MNNNLPHDLLIECRSCGIENNIASYVPSMYIFCNQCRERLIDNDIVQSHHEYICEKCDMKLILLKTTMVKVGESACSCGSTDLLDVGATGLPDEVAKAGGLIDPDENDGAILEDTDWLRPGDSGDLVDDDYEDMFNQDPGQN